MRPVRKFVGLWVPQYKCLRACLFVRILRTRLRRFLKMLSPSRIPNAGVWSSTEKAGILKIQNDKSDFSGRSVFRILATMDSILTAQGT